MLKKHGIRIVLPLLFVMAGAISACDGDMSVNKNLRVDDGEIHIGDLSTVNGSIYVGKDKAIASP